MTRNRRLITTASALIGLTILIESGAGACAQDIVANVVVANQNDFPIRVKRVGLMDDDAATADLAGRGTSAFDAINFRGDQVFMAWRSDGQSSGQFVGTYTVTASGANSANAGGNDFWLAVGPRGISPALKPRRRDALAQPGNPGEVPNTGVREYYAANLGIRYEFIPLNNGSFGAKLTRPPVPNSPAAQLQLEPGDTIVTLDDLPLNGPNDVLSHFDQTSLVFIDVRTGQPKGASLILPPNR